MKKEIFQIMNFMIFSGLLYFIYKKYLSNMVKERKDSYEKDIAIKSESLKNAMLKNSECSKNLIELDKKIEIIKNSETRKLKEDIEQLGIKKNEQIQKLEKENELLKRAYQNKKNETIRNEYTKLISSKAKSKFLKIMNPQKQKDLIKAISRNYKEGGI